MSWFRVDDSFADHEKVEALEADWLTHALAVAAWTLLGSDSARRKLDGLVTPGRVAKVLHCWPERKREQACAALVTVGLWHSVEGGWRYHDWTDYQPTREEMDRGRAASRERQRAWKAKRRGGNTVGNAVTASVTNAVDTGVDNTAPSRPVPSRPVEEIGDPPDLPLGRVLQGFRKRHNAKTATTGNPIQSSHLDRAREIAAEYADRPHDLAASLDGFFASSDPFVTKTRWSFKLWANDPARFLDAAPPKPATRAEFDPRCMAPQTPAEEKTMNAWIADGCPPKGGWRPIV